MVAGRKTNNKNMEETDESDINSKEAALDLATATADDADFNEKYEYLPDTEAAERLVLAQESEEVNRDLPSSLMTSCSRSTLT